MGRLAILRFGNVFASSKAAGTTQFWETWLGAVGASMFVETILGVIRSSSGCLSL